MNDTEQASQLDVLIAQQLNKDALGAAGVPFQQLSPEKQEALLESFSKEFPDIFILFLEE